MKSIHVCLSVWITLFSHFSFSVFAQDTNPITVRIGTAGNSYPYNYTCDADLKPDQKGVRVCGIEVDYFNRICSDMNMQCTWVIHPWSASTSSDPLQEGGLLYDLLNPEKGKPADLDDSYLYDVAISSLGASPDRRLQMLFTMSYYEPRDILIGDNSVFKFMPEDFNGSGFPVDKPYFSDPTRKLRIGTLPGNLYQHLIEAYPIKPTHIEFVATSNYDRELVEGKIDLAMAWTGIEQKIRDITNGGGNTQFGVVSILASGVADPLNGVVVPSRISKTGRQLNEWFNQGILKSRSSGGNGGYHWQIFTDAFNVDLWPCRRNPYVAGDPKCGNIPQ